MTDGVQAVAFLDAQSAGVDDGGLSLGCGSRDRQDGDDVGNLCCVDGGSVQLGWEDLDKIGSHVHPCAHPLQNLTDLSVALQRIHIHAGDSNGGGCFADGSCAQPEGGVAPVALRGQLLGRGVALFAKHLPSVFQRQDADAKLLEQLQSHLDVAFRLQRRGQQDAAVLLQQRKSKQQSGDVLRADITGKEEVPASQFSADVQRQAVAVFGQLQRNAVGGKLGAERFHRALGKASVSGKDCAASQRGTDRHQKAQGGAGFVAVAQNFRLCRLVGRENPVHDGAVVFKAYRCAQRADDVGGRLNVLREGIAMNQ